MRKFTLNEKEYKAIPFDFNAMCDLEDLGISTEEIGNKPVSMLRAYFSLCSGLPVKDAGVEISKHIESGKDLDELTEVMTAEIEESGFFRALTKGA